MSKNQFTGTATQPQRNRNATANFVNLIRTSTVQGPDSLVFSVTLFAPQHLLLSLCYSTGHYQIDLMTGSGAVALRLM